MKHEILPLLLALLLLPSTSRAERDSGAEALASRASATVDQHCSDAAQADVTLAAESVALVSAVWAEVSKALEGTRKIYLLYWRGVLGQCLDQEAKALTDFEDFVQARGESNAWASQTADALRRIRVLRRKLGVRDAPPPGTPGFGLGAALAGGAAAAGGISGWQWSRALAVASELAAGNHVGGDVSVYEAAGEDAATASRVLAVAAVGLGAAGAVSVVLGATRRPRVSGRAAVVAPFVAPVRGGAVAGFGGTW